MMHVICMRSADNHLVTSQSVPLHPGFEPETDRVDIDAVCATVARNAEGWGYTPDQVRIRVVTPDQFAEVMKAQVATEAAAAAAVESKSATPEERLKRLGLSVDDLKALLAKTAGADEGNG